MISLQVAEDLNEIKSLLWFPPIESHIWVKIIIDDVMVGFFEFQPLTVVVVNIHLHIFKPFRNKGIGSNLMPALNAFAVEKGLVGFTATVREKNIPIRKVLERADFKPLGSIPFGAIFKDQVDNLLIYS